MKTTQDKNHAKPSPDPICPATHKNQIEELKRRVQLQQDMKGYFLAHFGVYHPRKERKLRVVFYAAMRCKEQALNYFLMKGPKMNNSILGILLRFRKERITVTCDIEQMFHSFLVCPEHRKYLCFYGSRVTQKKNPIIEWRMNIHVFGNKSSPAVCVYGLRRAVETSTETNELAARLVRINMYIDDGIISLPSVAEAKSLVTDKQRILAESKIRLCKIVSNSQS